MIQYYITIIFFFYQNDKTAVLVRIISLKQNTSQMHTSRFTDLKIEIQTPREKVTPNIYNKHFQSVTATN